MVKKIYTFFQTKTAQKPQHVHISKPRKEFLKPVENWKNVGKGDTRESIVCKAKCKPSDFTSWLLFAREKQKQKPISSAFLQSKPIQFSIPFTIQTYALSSYNLQTQTDSGLI